MTLSVLPHAVFALAPCFSPGVLTNFLEVMVTIPRDKLGGIYGPLVTGHFSAPTLAFLQGAVGVSADSGAADAFLCRATLSGRTVAR